MTVGIERRDGSMEEMSVTEFTRWMCLVEAFHFIEEKAKELNVNPDDLIKPLAIESYIYGNEAQGFHGRYESMLHDVQCELKLGNL